MPIILRVPPEEAAAQLLEILKARGILDAKGDVVVPETQAGVVDEPRHEPTRESEILLAQKKQGHRTSSGVVFLVRDKTCGNPQKQVVVKSGTT